MADPVNAPRGPELRAGYADGAVRCAWRADWVPAGATAILRALDEAGAPVGGLTIAYDGATATITGATLAEGLHLRLKLDLRADDDSDASLVVHVLEPPATPVVDDWAQGLRVRWTAAPGAAAYRVEIADAAGNPLVPQPAVDTPLDGDALSARVDGAALADGGAYLVRVAATSEGSTGPWSASARWTLDKSAPDSPLLRAVRARLVAAGATPVLGPDLIGDPAVAAVVAALLGPDPIALTGAVVSAARDHVEVEGGVAATGGGTALFADGAKLTARFTDEGGLKLVVDAPLVATTPAALAAARLLPGSQWPVDDWATGLAPFGALRLTLNSADAGIVIGGGESGEAWNLVSIAGVELGRVRPDLVVRWVDGQRVYDPGVKAGLAVNGATLPIRLVLPSGSDGWRIALDAPQGLPLPGLAVLGALFAGGGTQLPAGVEALGGLRLDTLSLAFAPREPVWRFAIGFAMDGGSWTVIERALVVDAIRVRLDWIVVTGGARPVCDVTGSLRGRILIAGAPVEAIIDVPVAADGWRLATAEPIALADLGGLGTLTGDDRDVVPGALRSLGTAGALLLDRAEMRFHPPSPASLDAVGLAFSASAFSVPGLDWLRVDSATLALAIARPMAADRSVDAVASIAARIGEDTLIAGQLARDGDRLAGTFRGSAGQTVTAGSLSAIVPAGEVEAALPPTLPRQFELADLSFSYDLGSSTLMYTGIELDLQVDWELVPDILTFRSASVELNLERAVSTAPWSVTGELVATVDIGTGVFTGVVTKEEARWSALLELEPDAPLDLTDLTRTLVGGPLRLPDGFPTVSIDDARVTIDIDTLETNAALATSATWTPRLLNAQGSMAQLGLSLWVGPKEGDAAAARPYRATVAGALAVAGLPTLAAACVTGSGDARSELLATLSPADREALSLDAAADALVAPGTLSTVPAPAGFGVPTFTSAGFYADLTNPSVVVWGEVERLGIAAFVARRMPPPATGTEAAGAEAGSGAAVLIATQGFRFADLLPASAPPAEREKFAALDGLLRVERAHLVLSSFTNEEGSGDVFAGIARVADAAGALRIAVPTPTLPAGLALRRGLNFSATLSLVGTLWENLGHVIEARAEQAIVLTALIDADVPANTLFQASLGGFTILQGLVLDHAAITYRPSAAATLTLSATGAVRIPTEAAPAAPDGADRPDETVLRFDGVVTVGDALASAELVVSRGSSLRHPLGLPGLTFDTLALVLDYRFTDADGKPDRRLSRFALRGQATLGGTRVDAWLLFAAAAPRVAAVRLGTAVSITALLEQLIGTGWSADLPPLSLTSGEAYYARDTLVDQGGKTYSPGLHLDARFAFLGRDFDLGATLADKVGLSGHARAPAPLVIGVVSLTDPRDAAAGPGIAIAARSDGPKTFGLAFGITLFGLRFDDGRLGYAHRDGKHGFEGAITYSGDTPFGKDPELAVRWTQEDGFQIVGWEGIVEVLADLERVFETAGSADACRAIGAMFTRAILKGECKTDLRLRAKQGAAVPTATVEVDIRYLISIPGPSERIVLNAWAPPLTLAFDIAQPSAFTATALAEMVRGTVVSGLDNLVRDILNNPAAAGLLAGALAVETLTEQALNALICRKADNPRLKDEYRFRTGRGPQPDPGRPRPPRPVAPDPAELAMGDVAAAGTAAGSGSVGAAAAAFTAADAAVIGAGAFLGALAASLAVLFGLESQEEKDARERKERLDRELDKVREQLRARLAIHDLAVTREGDHGLAVSCRAIGEPTRYRFTVDITGRDGTHGRVEVGADRTGTDNVVHVVDPAVGPGATVRVTASAVLPLGDEWLDGAAGDGEFRLPDHGPASLRAEQVGGAVHLAWQPAPDPVQQWRVRAGPAVADPAVPAREESVPGDTLAWVLADAAAGVDYLFTVVADGIAGAVPATLRFRPSAARGPTGVHWFLDGETERLQAGWQLPEVPMAVRTTLRVGAREETRDAAAGAAAEAWFDAVALGVPGTRMRMATMDGAVPVWTEWLAIDLSAPPAPEVRDLGFRDPELIARWQAPDAADRVEIRFLVTGEAGARVLPAEMRHEALLWTGSQRADLAEGEGVETQARTVRGSVAGRWQGAGEAGRLTIRTLPVAAALTAAIEPDALALGWAAVPGAAGYEALVLDAATLAVLACEQVEAPALVLAGARLATAARVRVEVRATLPHLFGPPASIEVEVGRLDAPTGVAARLEGRMIVLTWAAVAGAAGYRVRVLDAAGGPLDPQPPTTLAGAEPGAKIDGTTLPAGTALRLEVAGVAPDRLIAASSPLPVTLDWLAPPGFAATYDGPVEQLRFDTIEADGADGLEAMVMDMAGEVFAAPVRSSGTTAPWALAPVALPHRLLRLRLRAWRGGDNSDWAESAPFDARPVTPSDLRVEDAGASLLVHFTPVAGVVRYQVEVLDGAGGPLDPPLVAESEGAPVVVAADRLPEVGDFQVRARSITRVRSQGEAA